MRNQRGFTLVEVLMVIMLVAILAAISIPQFIDFRADAKDAATQSNVGTLRTAIVNQYANMTVRCGATPGTFPTAAQITANDITTGGNPCSTTEVANTVDRQFVVGGTISDNPWSGGAVKNTVTACVGVDGCNQTDATNCAGDPYGPTDSGWCYNPANGKIWANSQNSTNTLKENNF